MVRWILVSLVRMAAMPDAGYAQLKKLRRCGFTDIGQLDFARTEQRVIVTFDPDFLALHQAGTSHAGIAWRPAQKHSIGAMIKSLLLVHGVLDCESMQNHVEYL